MFHRRMVPLFLLTAVVLFPSRVWAMGTETFGSKPLNERNYNQWKGIMPLVNHPSRVYHTWVNGNEHFYYEADMAALNDLLQKFVAMEMAVHEVLLRPGPGATSTFRRKKVAFQCCLHLVGGVSRFLTTLDRGAEIWSSSPQLIICVEAKMDLSKLHVPPGVTLLDPTTLSRRYREALKSSDKTVRGWGAGKLALLDPYNAENLQAVAALLDDKDDWVQLNAVGALPKFGKKAAPLLPKLREMLSVKDKQLSDRIPKTIQIIQKSSEDPAAEKAHRASLQRIAEFIKSNSPRQGK